MQMFKTVPKRWGNSLGVTIPKEIVDRERLSPGKKVKVFVVGDRTNELRKIFGSLKLKKPIQQIMDEIDEEGYD
ncbi:MAG: AbrB/MazE/SpoVT family DNA-binding domain-containing protein [Nanoarchaeota archaeon]